MKFQNIVQLDKLQNRCMRLVDNIEEICDVFLEMDRYLKKVIEEVRYKVILFPLPYNFILIFF